MKKVLKIVGIILVFLILVFGILMMVMITNQNKQIKRLEFDDIDMSKVVDGNYEGRAETSLVKATVSVTVVNHEITEIKILRHENGKGKAAEGIVGDMVEGNTYDVDAISGATVSSTVIKNAVYKALITGMKE